MKILRTHYIIIFVVCSFQLFSQQNRSLEIIVSDSIMLKPIGFTYSITYEEVKKIVVNPFQDNSESDDTGEKPTATETNKKEKPDIEKILKQNNINYTLQKNIDYSIGKPGSSMSLSSVESQLSSPTYIIKLKSKDELEKLNQIFSSTEGITGKITNVDYESPENYKKDLFNKLFIKAKNEANLLASATDSKLGKLISVTEVKEEWSFFRDLLDKFGSLIPFNIFDLSNPYVKSYERKMQFKFE